VTAKGRGVYDVQFSPPLKLAESNLDTCTPVGHALFSLDRNGAPENDRHRRARDVALARRLARQYFDPADALEGVGLPE
jgi:hypothetical protein